MKRWYILACAILALAGIVLGLFAGLGRTSSDVVADAAVDPYSAFEDTSGYIGPVRLRSVEGGWEDMQSAVLAGDWIYYVKLGKSMDEDYWNDSERVNYGQLCRCRIDLSGEEVLSEDELFANGFGVNLLRDMGDGLLAWYETYSDAGRTVFHFVKLDYETGAPTPVAEFQLRGMQNISALTVAHDKLWFSWFDFKIDASREGATGKLDYAIGEIYELPLTGGEPKCLLSEARMIYDTTYAHGKLFFMDKDDDGLYYCTLDPETGARKVLLRVSPDAAPGDADGRRFTVVGGRFYCWNDDKKATVSMRLDGTNQRIVSKDRFGFRQVWNGCVLAARQIYDDTSGSNWYADHSTFVFHPKDPEAPVFDPDNDAAGQVGDSFDFILGDRLYTIDHGDPPDYSVSDMVAKEIP